MADCDVFWRSPLIILSNTFHHYPMNSSISSIFADFFKDEILRGKAEKLMDKLQEGSICLPLTVQEYQKLLDSPFVGVGNVKKPFIVEKGNLYLQRYYEYETQIIGRIKALVEQKNEAFANALLQKMDLVKQLFVSDASEVDWQLVAAVSAVINNFSIISGGPGTGKTTTVSKIIVLLNSINPELKVALAAPTGKAAMRMKESIANSVANMAIDLSLKEKLSAIVPLTIHRLLGYVKDSPYFRHNATNPLDYDLLIIDEASMIDVPQMAKLLDATRDSSKLILLGDKNQLASVEAGSVFSDLCETVQIANTFSSDFIHFFNKIVSVFNTQLNQTQQTNEKHFLNTSIVELQRSRRFDATKGIGLFSKYVIEGNSEQLQHWQGGKVAEQEGVDICNGLPQVKDEIKEYRHYILEPDIKKALSLTQKLRLLCATKEGEFGLYQCNKYAEMVLKEAGVLQPKPGFYENQLIMVSANDYTLNLFNGDVGIVRRDANTQTLYAYFEDANAENGLKFVPTIYLKNFETAFAMTIHKSQGSEFDTVIVVLPQRENLVLTRELLYTAVTRAKKKVKLIANKTVLNHTVKGQVQRSSGITKRIVEWL